jgi:NTE family protein
MSSQFRNLVFEGGGVKGIAYVGAMEVLESKGILPDIRRVGGTSAGAINAALLALGYDHAQTKDILSRLDFTAFQDAGRCPAGNLWRVFKRFGWYKGDFFLGWLGDLIQEKLHDRRATFQDLHDQGRPDLYVYGTNLGTHYSEVFSVERHASMPLAEAVRMSMSIPLFFAAIKMSGTVYVDGGVLDNYPVKLFDRRKYLLPLEGRDPARRTDYYDRINALFLAARPEGNPYVFNKQTLGFRLDAKEEISLFRHDEPTVHHIRGLGDYLTALTKTILDSQNNQHLHGDDWQRTVYLDSLEVRTTDFTLSEEKKAALIQAGREGTERYFAWFEDPRESPVNRV